MYDAKAERATVLCERARMSGRKDDPGGRVDAIPARIDDALRAVLQPGEVITDVVRAVGCSLVLTERHLVLVRDGSSYRPRSGVHVWPLDRTVTVHTTPVLHGTGRIVIEHGGTTSVFVSADEWDAADTLLRKLHRRVHAAD
jgi:hypothetical protein